jgi:uncharacterized protein YrzB (UPF0473 family)
MSNRENDDLELEDEIIEVEDEFGNVREMIISVTFEATYAGKDKVYAVLIDRNDLNGEAVIVIYEESEEGEISLENIEDDAEWDYVLEVFDQLETE